MMNEGMDDSALEVLSRLRIKMEELLMVRCESKPSDLVHNGESFRTISNLQSYPDIGNSLMRKPGHRIHHDAFKLDSLQRENSDCREQIFELSSSVHAKCNEIKDLRLQINQLTQEFDEREKQLIATIERLRKTETAYRLVSTEVVNTNSLIAKAKLQTHQFQTEIQSHIDSADGFKTALIGLQDKKDRAEVLLQNRHNVLQEMNKKLQASTQRVLTQETEINFMGVKYARLVQQITSLEKMSNSRLHEATVAKELAKRCDELRSATEDELKVCHSTINSMQLAVDNLNKTQSSALKQLEEKVLQFKEDQPNMESSNSEHNVEEVDEDATSCKKLKMDEQTKSAEPNNLAQTQSNMITDVVKTCGICHSKASGLMKYCEHCRGCMHSLCFRKHNIDGGCLGFTVSI